MTVNRESGWAGETLAPDYGEARRRFLAAAEAAGASVEAFPHPTSLDQDGRPVAIDVARLGPTDATSVLLVVSATHGVEGYAGSALQTAWLARPTRALPRSTRLVLVHGLNPHGFAWTRRTNEDNVDLNRNFIDWTAPPPDNPGYDDLADILVPDTWDGDTQAATTGALLEEVGRRGLPEMQRIISGGQYRHQRGVFYGGTGPAWSNRWLHEQAPALLGSAERLAVVDLHTGLGPWGHGELIVCEPRAHPRSQRAERWWGDVRSMQDGDSVSAELTGDWLGTVGELWPTAEVTAVALEFGTVDEIQVLQALRADAWLHANPEADREFGSAVRQQVRSAFADDDPAWLATLTARFEEVVGAALDQLAG